MDTRMAVCDIRRLGFLRALDRECASEWRNMQAARRKARQEPQYGEGWRMWAGRHRHTLWHLLTIRRLARAYLRGRMS